MSSTLDAAQEIMPMSRTPRFATDAATELGDTFEELVAPSGSTNLPAEELAVATVDFEAAEHFGHSRKTLWYLVYQQRNELVHQARFEAGAEQLGFPAQPTASATELAELWRATETLIAHRDPAFSPSRTQLGEKLRDIRRAYLLRGGRLLTADELVTELSSRRGERE